MQSAAGDVESGKKLHVIPGGKKGTEAQHIGHTAHILSMAISSDGKYLVRRSGQALPSPRLAGWLTLVLEPCGERSLLSVNFLLAVSFLLHCKC